jgi:hypothetical protein
MEKAIALGGLNASFALRHAFRMALNDGQLERAIELVGTISEARIKEGSAEEIAAGYKAIIPVLHSREQTLDYLNDQQPDSEDARVEINWLMDIYWAAYYGDYALAQKILDRGTDYGQSPLDTLDTTWFNYPLLNPIRNSDAYKRMITRSNLDQFWRANGFPKHCRPLGDDDFACN